MVQRKLGPQTLPEIPRMSRDGTEKEARVAFSSLLVILQQRCGKRNDCKRVHCRVFPVGTVLGGLWQETVAGNHALISFFLLPPPHLPIAGFFCQGGRFIYDSIGLSSYIFAQRLSHNLAQGSQKWLLLPSSMYRR